MRQIVILLMISVALLQAENTHTYRINSISEPPVIDGYIDDLIWNDMPIATGFTQYLPESGAPGSKETEVKLACDDQYIYVAARMFDDPELIAQQLLRRDNRGYSDEFGVGIDSYFDRRTSFSFYLTPGGSKQDRLWYNDQYSDDSWDAIWDGKTRIDDLGWTAEFRIPLSQLRYNKNEDMDKWGINFYRYIARNDEHDYWSPLPAESPSEVAVYGTLLGVEAIPEVGRWDVRPYISGGLSQNGEEESNPLVSRNEFTPGVGADIKIGLGSNFTLTATLLPDFGQVEADPSVVNLSANETYFGEQRPFFTEGLDIFDFGRTRTFYSNIPIMFYSRRIGRPPRVNLSHSDYNHLKYPGETTILAAGKLNGKTSNGWSLGILNTVSSEEKAVYIDTLGSEQSELVEPLTNTMIARVRKDMSEGTTTVGGYFAAVDRTLDTDHLDTSLVKNARIVGIDFEHRFHNYEDWIISSVFVNSYLSGSPNSIMDIQRASPRYFQRPDADHLELEENLESISGSTFELSLFKDNGEHWLGSLTYCQVTPGFEINDVGFMQRGDYRSIAGLGLYKQETPGKFMRSYQFLGGAWQAWNFGNEEVWSNAFVSFSTRFTNFWYFMTELGISGSGIDDRLTRGGPSTADPSGKWITSRLESDRRKKFSGGLKIKKSADEFGEDGFSLSPNIKWRPRPAITFSSSYDFGSNFLARQYTGVIEDEYALDSYGSRYLFSEVAVEQHSFQGRLEWTFSPDLTFQLVSSPLFTTWDYQALKELIEEGKDFHTYALGNGIVAMDSTGAMVIDPDGAGAAASFEVGNNDFRYSVVQTNAVLRWEFRPGSTLYLVWQHDLESFLSGTEAELNKSIARNFEGLKNAQGLNTIMVKVNYRIGG